MELGNVKKDKREEIGGRKEVRVTESGRRGSGGLKGVKRHDDDETKRSHGWHF